MEFTIYLAVLSPFNAQKIPPRWFTSALNFETSETGHRGRAVVSQQK